MEGDRDLFELSIGLLRFLVLAVELGLELVVEVLDLVGVGVEEFIDLVEMVLSLVGDLLADLNVFAVFWVLRVNLMLKFLDAAFDYLNRVSEGNDFS